jgi:hypothetical protein
MYKKECRYCKELILERATFCKYCQRSQNRMRNELIFLGSIITFLTFVFSGSIFISREIYQLHRSWFGEDKLSVKSFLEYDKIVVHNSGFRDVTLLEVEIRSQLLNRLFIYEINESIPVNGVTSSRVGNDQKYQMATIDRDLVTAAAGETTIKEVMPVAALPTDRDYQRWVTQSTGEPITFPCVGLLHFIPFGENEVKQIEFECLYFAAFTPSIDAWFEVKPTVQRKMEKG